MYINFVAESSGTQHFPRRGKLGALSEIVIALLLIPRKLDKRIFVVSYAVAGLGSLWQSDLFGEKCGNNGIAIFQ